MTGTSLSQKPKCEFYCLSFEFREVKWLMKTIRLFNHLHFGDVHNYANYLLKVQGRHRTAQAVGIYFLRQVIESS